MGANSQNAYRGVPVNVAGGNQDFTSDPFDALYVGGAGSVAMVDKGGNSLTFVCPAGGYILCGGTQVTQSGTDATSVIALYNHL